MENQLIENNFQECIREIEKDCGIKVKNALLLMNTNYGDVSITLKPHRLADDAMLLERILRKVIVNLVHKQYASGQLMKCPECGGTGELVDLELCKRCQGGGELVVTIPQEENLRVQSDL